MSWVDVTLPLPSFRYARRYKSRVSQWLRYYWWMDGWWLLLGVPGQGQVRARRVWLGLAVRGQRDEGHWPTKWPRTIVEGFRWSLWEDFRWLPLLAALVPNANTDGREGKEEDAIFVEMGIGKISGFCLSVCMYVCVCIYFVMFFFVYLSWN